MSDKASDLTPISLRPCLIDAWVDALIDACHDDRLAWLDDRIVMNMNNDLICSNTAIYHSFDSHTRQFDSSLKKKVCLSTYKNKNRKKTPLEK